MLIDKPDVRAEVEAAFHRYDRAVLDNDNATLAALFWTSESTVRFGATESLVGKTEIDAFRSTRVPSSVPRRTERLIVTSFGDEFGTTSVLFRRDGSSRQGRWTQTWIKVEGSWRIVSTHASTVSD